MVCLQICNHVNEKLNKLSLEERIKIFKDLLNYPVDYIDEVYYHNGSISDKEIVSSYLQIRQHWMRMQEFDKLFEYFKNEKTV
jgi:hypothetical protein